MERSRDPATGRYICEHGGKRSRLYRIWCAMKERCNNPHNKGFTHYGGRGIHVCDAWATDYAAFAEWAVRNGYQPGLTIDRINNNAGYNPDNCRWVTQAEQNRNYSRNMFLTINGDTKCLSDWADITGVNRATLAFRLKSGLSPEEAIINIDRRSTRWMRQNTQLSQI